MGERGEFAGELFRGVQRGAGGDDAVHEAYRERLGGTDTAAGEDHVEGTALADEAG